MEPLGYIVSDRKIIGLKDFVKQVDKISDADTSKPTLIVGLDLAKSISDSFSILNKKLGDNLFWTFKKTERRTEYDRDINIFYNNIIYNNINNIKYYYINIIKLNYTSIKKLYNIVFSNDSKYIFIDNGMIYILHDDVVFGISINILQYMKINTKKIIDRLYSNPNNIICDDSTICMKSIRGEIGSNKYAVPYLMSKM